MHVTFIQALLIGLFCYLGSLPAPNNTWGWYGIGRPLVAGTIVGIILGDPMTGMIIGATINAVFIGAITPGGAMSSDMNFAGYVGTALAMMTSAAPEMAVSLAVPIGIVGVFVWNAWASLNVVFAQIADRRAIKGDVKGIWAIGIIVPQIINVLFRFLPCFLVVMLGSQIGDSLATAIPGWLTIALGKVGGMLPAIGMALLLKMMITKPNYWSYFLLGFLAVAVLKIGTVPLSIFGVAAALIVLSIKHDKISKEVA